MYQWSVVHTFLATRALLIEYEGMSRVAANVAALTFTVSEHENQYTRDYLAACVARIQIRYLHRAIPHTREYTSRLPGERY